MMTTATSSIFHSIYSSKVSKIKNNGFEFWQEARNFGAEEK